MPPFDYQAAAQERQRNAKMLRDAAPDLLAALEHVDDYLAPEGDEEDEVLAKLSIRR
jgi:hypothetical protein